jgi:uracil-DNA glycosylase family 4
MNPFMCQICGNPKCVPPSGSEKSPILVIAEFPGRDEIIKGRPLIGRTGDVLRSEMGMVGLDLHRMRVMNLWQHEPNNNEECYALGFKTVIEEAVEKQAILLLGSDVVRAFCDDSVERVCGTRVESFYLSAPIILACVNPATVFHGCVGELRLALQKFSRLVEDIL